MPLNNTKAFLAKIAYNEALRGGTNMPEHFIEDATWYVDEAINQMELHHSYDPETYAVNLSELAIVAYVRAKLENKDPLQQSKEKREQWAVEAANEWLAAQVIVDSEDTLSHDVFRSILNEGMVLLTRHLAEIKTVLAEATAYLSEVSTYDPTVLATDAGDRARKIYAESRIKGSDPIIIPGFVAAVNAWQRAAAMENYDAYPDTYPDYPDYRRRLRDFSTKIFPPTS